MSKTVVLEGPINSTSLGQTFVNVLYEFYKKEIPIILFPIGNQADLGVFNGLLNDDFLNWIRQKSDKNIEKFDREMPYLKWWHIRDSQAKITDKTFLYTFHELDQVTPAELNIIQSYNKVFFSSKYSVETFGDYGAENTVNIPLAFDNLSFSEKTDKRYLRDQGVISFGLYGKAEHRKNHVEVVQSWIKKYGNKSKYRLNLAIFNPFLNEQQFNDFLARCFSGESKPFNVNIFPFLQSNQEYNDLLNGTDIVIDMSGGEAWSLPSFTSVALGKYGVILNATGMKEWANDKNSVLVKPQGKKPSADGMFFAPNIPFNQGNFYCFNQDEFIDACETAEKKYESNPINQEGLKLQDKFTYSKTVDQILENL